MAYSINFRFPDGWTAEQDTYIDESGVEITHLEARLKDRKGSQAAYLEIFVGDMPEGETAQDQAFANYAESVGFDGEEDECGIAQFTLNGKPAWGFDAVTEDDDPMRFLAQEVKKGVLAIIVYFVREERRIGEVFDLVDRSLRVR